MMRTAKTWLVLTVMAALVLSAVPARAADVDGKWGGAIDTPMGPINIFFTFKADGATLTGTTTGPDGGEIPIKNGKIDADRISFVVSIDFGGMALDLNYTGVVKPDAVNLTIDFMGMPVPVTVKKMQ